MLLKKKGVGGRGVNRKQRTQVCFYISIVLIKIYTFIHITAIYSTK